MVFPHLALCVCFASFLLLSFLSCPSLLKIPYLPVLTLTPRCTETSSGTSPSRSSTPTRAWPRDHLGLALAALRLDLDGDEQVRALDVLELEGVRGKAESEITETARTSGSGSGTMRSTSSSSSVSPSAPSTCTWIVARLRRDKLGRLQTRPLLRHAAWSRNPASASSSSSPNTPLPSSRRRPMPLHPSSLLDYLISRSATATVMNMIMLSHLASHRMYLSPHPAYVSSRLVSSHIAPHHASRITHSSSSVLTLLHTFCIHPSYA
ncbi:hypothetical protein K438DRAFT_260054 [Mycena galopus ATCC 62051]|nr:hypothetical protein K438DRAFT_260054 [Mycena galopus ATCC 62051]